MLFLQKAANNNTEFGDESYTSKVGKYKFSLLINPVIDALYTDCIVPVDWFWVYIHRCYVNEVNEKQKIPLCQVCQNSK